MPLAELPHPEIWSAPLDSAVADVPLTRMSIGVPSTVSRSAKHWAGMAAGVAGATTPGNPTSAMPTGKIWWPFE